LLVANFNVTLPAEISATLGVYTKLNGVTLEDIGLNVPVPNEKGVTKVVEPAKVPVIVLVAPTQRLPELVDKVTVGGFTHPQVLPTTTFIVSAQLPLVHI
jgi:hypothetical protein